MKAYERLLNYVKVPTPSNEKSGTHPSSECQRVLADQLAEEMKALGVSDVRVEDKCYVYGKIPATKGYEGKTKLGFIAHMDTVSDFADHAVNPIVHENYDGKDLKLADSGRTLEVSVFPHLPSLAGRTLITSDGTTVRFPSDLHRMRRSVKALTFLMFQALTQSLPIPWTAAQREKSNSKTSMQPERNSR